MHLFNAIYALKFFKYSLKYTFSPEPYLIISLYQSLAIRGTKRLKVFSIEHRHFQSLLETGEPAKR